MTKVKLVCKNCNKEFLRSPSRINKYCSRSCFYAKKETWNKGLRGFLAGEKSPHWKGGKPKCEKCGNKLSQKNPDYLLCKKCLSSNEQYIKNLSNAHRKPLESRAKKNYSHNVRNSVYFKEWRSRVFFNDGFTCQICGETKKLFNAHHIFSFTDFPDLRFIPSNGVTLCLDCHYLVHKKETGLADAGWYIKR